MLIRLLHKVTGNSNYGVMHFSAKRWSFHKGNRDAEASAIKKALTEYLKTAVILPGDTIKFEVIGGEIAERIAEDCE